MVASVNREPFLKDDPSADAGSYLCEAAGLRWLGVAEGAPVVEVLAADDSSLTLQRLIPTQVTRDSAARFGVQLAQTHAAGAQAWGCPPPGWDRPHGWIGTQRMPLVPAARWGQMYAEQRLLPFIEAAAEQFSARDRATLDAVCAKLQAGDFDDVDAPARIHGDLWSGNAVPTDNGITLIDPAAHGGHPVTDLAMLELFGYPELEAIFDAYEAESTQLPSGWRDFLGLHQLHPLLVHTVTHSPMYGREAAEIAARFA